MLSSKLAKDKQAPFTQPSLFDQGDHAKRTRLMAFERSTEKRPNRRETILELFRSRGRLGYTRWEIADELDLPVNCVTAAVSGLLRDGTLAEIPSTRPSRLGGLGAVMQLVEQTKP